MYEQVAHNLLNEILDDLDPALRGPDLRHFFTRLGANFYAIHGLFGELYGHREDFAEQLAHLVRVLAERYVDRPAELRRADREREAAHDWFLHQRWVGMALYVDGFAGDLSGVRERLSHLEELGVNLLHLMPMLVGPPGQSDGGYAVSDYHRLNPKLGRMEDLTDLAASLRRRGMLLAVDVVVNHTSDQHAWAERARAGEKRYLDYYYTFETRDVPDMFEESMPEVFPETSPGNFIHDEAMGRWVMSVFNSYQWDLNYTNPAVFVEMVDILLSWANRGADILRLDAVAFLWKAIGTSSQNLREAHLLLQLFKDCCQVTAPGVVFIAEAIVAPVEVTKYFGEDAVVSKECEIAYNATLMALLWDAVATHNAKLLNAGIRSLPDKLSGATWLNYVRCHDDIGLAFDDADIGASGYDPREHRRFLVNYFTGRFDGSTSRGTTFASNQKTGDARISGSLASLIGLEHALAVGDPEAIARCIRRIHLLYGVMLSFGGIPMFYYGDEVGTLNDYGFRDDPDKAADSRWLHRPKLDWGTIDQRRVSGTHQQRLFDGISHLVAVRKATRSFADFNNRELVAFGSSALFGYVRSHPKLPGEAVLVIGNFDAHPQHVGLEELAQQVPGARGLDYDLVTDREPLRFQDALVVPAYGFYWLTDRRAGELVRQARERAEAGG